MVADINPGAADANPRYMAWYKNEMYFQANDGVFGKELWKTDGTSAGTLLVADIRPGSGSSNPSFFTTFTSTLDQSVYLMFTATDGFAITGDALEEGIGGSQFFRSDGTAAGTFRSFDRTYNDLYIDRQSLDIQHPAKLVSFEDGLYVPAQFSASNLHAPSGGLYVANDERTFGVDQAFVIRDLDTPPQSNITVVLEVDKGAIAMKSFTKESKSSPPVLKFIVAEADSSVRSLLANGLTNLGSSVYTENAGEAALDKIKFQYSEFLKYKSDVTRPFDCLMISMEFGGGYDAAQVVREIRAWESTITSATYNKLKIIGMSRLRMFIGQPGPVELLAAGVDMFMWQPEVDYIPAAEAADIILVQGTTTTKQAAATVNQKARYLEFANVAIRFNTEVNRDMSITAQWLDPSKILSTEVLATLPAVTVGQRIVVEGTVAQVNSAMRGVYFYAPENTNGNITMSATVTTDPASCLGYDGLLPTQPQRFVQRPSLSILPSSDVYGAFGNSSNIMNSFCDRNQTTKSVAYIPIFVIAVNQPPTAILTETAFTSQVNLDTPVPTFTVEDVDHLESLLQTSLGFELQPSITVTMSTVSGLLTLLYRDDVVFLRGQGSDDRVITIKGALDKVNAAVRTASYKCRLADGCSGGYVDTITILIDDEGFRGKGGALTYTTSISVNISE